MRTESMLRSQVKSPAESGLDALFQTNRFTVRPLHRQDAMPLWRLLQDSIATGPLASSVPGELAVWLEQSSVQDGKTSGCWAVAADNDPLKPIGLLVLDGGRNPHCPQLGLYLDAGYKSDAQELLNAFLLFCFCLRFPVALEGVTASLSGTELEPYLGLGFQEQATGHEYERSAGARQLLLTRKDWLLAQQSSP